MDQHLEDSYMKCVSVDFQTNHDDGDHNDHGDTAMKLQERKP